MSKSNKVSLKDLVPKWILQLLLNLSMLSLGVMTCIKGPALLTLQSKYDTSIETISLMFLLTSIGGLFGVGIWTILLDFIPDWRLFIFAANVLFSGVSSALIPQGNHISSLLVVSAWNGIHSGVIHAGVNVLCMELWRGLNCGPYMHSIHLSFSIGGFIGPLLSKPFISNSIYGSPMELLFGLASIPMVTIGISLFIYAIARRDHFITRKPINHHEESDKVERQSQLGIESILLIALMFVFFIIHVVVEFSNFSYMPTMAVKLDLHLSEREGANILAFFMAGFSCARGLAIPLAVKVSPKYLLIVNLTLILIGSILLVVLGQSEKWVLEVGYTLSGLGMGSMFVNSWVWLEQYLTVGYRVANTFNIGCGIATVVSPLFIGNLVNDFPMTLIYTQLTAAIAASFIFSFGTYLGSKILQKRSALKVEDSATVLAIKIETSLGL
ncbi:sodium-dependent glucose transporter 1A-like [Tigriopus californicus]|uniref:sodium-dependent glucose transporter 1A-like n=1 Tax=Tigriopus californicus TaxID=6832 RepID=UPI0027D9DEB9|nr:sodium-dependent glucose transporter 1A-like [Tigriopus californicus]